MRYFIYLSFDGRSYHGWQIQPNSISIQSTLQKSISTILRSDIDIVGAGRTDTGVNATEMVAHFDYPTTIESKELVMKLNKFLPNDIFINKIVPVRPDAHARFDAISRTYKYYLSSCKHPILRHYSFCFSHPLDYAKMNEASLKMFNYTDFTSFSKLHTDTKTNICHIKAAQWRRVSLPVPLNDNTEMELWEFTITADRFLRNMVRAIVGTLIDVGRGVLSTNDFCKVIEQKNRCSAGMSVPGHALFLDKIVYPDSIFNLE